MYFSDKTNILYFKSRYCTFLVLMNAFSTVFATFSANFELFWFDFALFSCKRLQEERRAQWRAHVQGRGVIRGEFVYAVWTSITIVIFQHSFYYIQSRYHWIIAEINVLQSKSFPATSEYCKNLDESHRKLMYQGF